MHQWSVRRSLPAVLGVLGILAASDPSPAGEQEYRLVYKFQPGQAVHYEVRHEMTVHTELGEASETVRNESTTHKHFNVASVDSKGIAVLDPVIDRVRMKARFNDSDPVEWDSKGNSDPPREFERVAETLGKSLARIKVAPNGELLWVVRLDPTRRSPEASQRPGEEVPDNDPSRNFLVVLPKTPIRVGDRWDDTIGVKVSVGGKLQRTVKLQRQYTLKSVSEHLATISLRTAVLTPVNNPRIRGQLIQRTPSGTIVFDFERGLLVSRELKIDKEEVGIADGRGLMRAKSEHVERLFEPNRTAGKPVGPPSAPDTATRE